MYTMSTLYKKIFFTFLPIMVFGIFSVASASESIGTINTSNYTAQVCEDTLCTETSTSPVNFGNFTTNTSYNVTIRDEYLSGYMWGKSFGWVILNCADTTSGCSGTNGNFKVANDNEGNLSGYAWGETAGWVNFGPFTNTTTSSVSINTRGEFNGYAWSQNFGWIKFDCSTVNYCVSTDWRPRSSRAVNTYGYMPPVKTVVTEFTVIPPFPALPVIPKFPLVPEFTGPVFTEPNFVPNSNVDKNIVIPQFRIPSQSAEFISFLDYLIDETRKSLEPIESMINKIKLFVDKNLAEILNTELGYIVTSIATLSGLVLGTTISVIPAIFLNPLSALERALIRSRFWKILVGPLRRKKENGNIDEEDHDVTHLLGPAHFVPKILATLFKIIFVIGFVVSIVLLYSESSLNNVLVFLAYCVIFILNVTVFREKI